MLAAAGACVVRLTIRSGAICSEMINANEALEAKFFLSFGQLLRESYKFAPERGFSRRHICMRIRDIKSISSYHLPEMYNVKATNKSRSVQEILSFR